MKSIILLIIICIVNFSCKNTKQVLQTSESNQSKQNSKTKVHPLENTSWIFQNYSRHKIDIKGQNLILKFGTVDNSELKYSGNSFVNKFSGSFQFSDNILTNT